MEKITIPGVNPDMIANNLDPAINVHPGEIIKDEIEYLGITQKELAKKMGVPYTMFNEILNKKRPVTAEIALLVEAVIGSPAYTLIHLQNDYNLLKAKRNKRFMQRLERIRNFQATNNTVQ